MLLTVVGTSASESGIDFGVTSPIGSSAPQESSIRFYKDGAALTAYMVNNATRGKMNSSDTPITIDEVRYPGGLWYIDQPSAGTYTYGVEYVTADEGTPTNMKLQAVEL